MDTRWRASVRSDLSFALSSTCAAHRNSRTQGKKVQVVGGAEHWLDRSEKSDK